MIKTSQLLFDEEGNILGFDKEVKKAESLMTSKQLSFLKEESLNQQEQNNDSPYWSLYENSEKLSPLKYSNGKTQEDVVKETLDLIKKGKKVILIKGVCGTGKSAIALNIARVLGKASIVVPVKNLQKQYEDDYTEKKYLLKKSRKKMKIAVITGRDNHDSLILPGVSCAYPFLPDTIIITEKNRDKIIKFYNENPLINNKIIPIVGKLKRISIAPSNPYWSPIIAADFPIPQLSDAKKKVYRGIFGRLFVFYHRKEGCSYYDQFQSYLDADVIIFNSAKYEIEMAIGRKPESEVDIIDEADSFLDHFSKEDSLNLTHLSISLQTLSPEFEEANTELDKIKELLSLELKNKNALGINEQHIFPLEETITGKMLKLLVRSFALQAEISLDEMHYSNRALETAFMFEDLFPDTYITYSKRENGTYAHLVTTNVAKRFSELSRKTKALILMSGTLHSEDVLKNVFGIKDFAVVEAETKMPGKIEISESGLEFSCDYKNLNSSENKRKEYLLALSSSIEKAKKPILIHVNAYEDLPKEEEIKKYSISNVISKEKLKSLQYEDKTGDLIAKFKEKASDILFSTKCSRGVDFPGDICNSIIFTKYPNPNTKDIFWKVLKKTHPIYFWKIYKDRAKREFLQRIYRALRSNDDHVFILSPDSRVLDAVRKLQ